MPFYNLFVKILSHFEDGLRNKLVIWLLIFSSHNLPNFKVEIGAIMEIVILIDWMKEIPDDLK